MVREIRNQLTVFTKPWPDKSLPELASFVKQLGFDGVELPVRQGFQVTPETVSQGLPEAAKIFADHGVKIGSIAASADETIIMACGEAGVPLVRIMARIDPQVNYYNAEDTFRKEFDAVLPVLDQSGVSIGVQNHAGNFIGSAIGIMHLIERYDPKHVGIVLDLAHCSLAGEPVPIAIDIAWSHLLLVNLKNGSWQQIGEDNHGEMQWRNYWTTSKQGLTSWRTVVDELKRRRYQGDICLTAEYSAPKEDSSVRVDDLIAEDLAYAKSLLED